MGIKTVSSPSRWSRTLLPVTFGYSLSCRYETNWGDERGCDEGHHTRWLPRSLPEVVRMVQTHALQPEEITSKEDKSFHVCVLSIKVPHTKKVRKNLFNDPQLYIKKKWKKLTPTVSLWIFFHVYDDPHQMLNKKNYLGILILLPAIYIYIYIYIYKGLFKKILSLIQN